MKRIANFLFEAGMLSAHRGQGSSSSVQGLNQWQSIYSGQSISDTLGNLAEGADTDRIIKMCLFHDLPEARTGDLNYVNKNM
jgi:putative hydrolase of HD superfamily